MLLAQWCFRFLLLLALSSGRARAGNTWMRCVALPSRLTMGAGALTAAVAALEQVVGDPQLAAMPAAQSLVSAALETGLRVAIDLQRPPDIASDEEMVELVDQVRDVAPDLSSADCGVRRWHLHCAEAFRCCAASACYDDLMWH
jgi:hypothetical protein